MNINKQEFTGYIGKFGKVAVSKSGKQVYTNTFAISEYNPKTKESKFINFNIVGFEKTAEMLQAIPEKQKVIIWTHLADNSYTNKDGKLVKSFTFVVDNVVMWELPNAGSYGYSAENSQQPTQSASQTADYVANDDYGINVDDLPF